MPAFYERSFRVRYDECDPYGHINLAIYLNYMQEAAFDASADVGYDFATYRAMGLHWLVRETDITFRRPLLYGDSVTVKTWVADFRRFRSRRMYELFFSGTCEPAAKAHTDWVLINTRTNFPAVIPQEFVHAFIPEGQPPERLKRERFPQPPAPTRGVFSENRLVRWRDIDGARHVNNAKYLTYLEDCGIESARQKGWPIKRMMSEGFGIIVRRYRIEYKQPAVMDDDIEIATWLSDVKRTSVIRHYTIRRHRDRQLLARASALWVWIDLETGKPRRIPAKFKEDVVGNIVTEQS